MLNTLMTTDYKRKEKGPLQITAVTLTEHDNGHVPLRTSGSSFHNYLRYRQRIPKPSTQRLERVSSCKLRNNLEYKLDIQVVGLSNQSSEISFLTVPNNSPKSTYFIGISDRPEHVEDLAVRHLNETVGNPLENGVPLDAKETAALTIVGRRKSTFSTTILPDIVYKTVKVTKPNSSDIEVNKCTMSQPMVYPIVAVEKYTNPEVTRSNPENTASSSSPYIPDKVSAIGKTIIGHDTMKLESHNMLDFNPGIVKHNNISCDKCVHRMKEQKPWKYGDTFYLRMSRWLESVQNATCSTGHDKIDRDKYESRLQHETNTGTARASQLDLSEKVSKSSTILKCWSDIWPLSTNADLQRKYISNKLKYSPEENRHEENQKKYKVATKMSGKDKLNVDSTIIKNSISSMSQLENNEIQTSSSNITPQLYLVKSRSESAGRNTLLDDNGIPSYGSKGMENIGPHQQVNTRDVPSVLAVPSVPGVLGVQSLPNPPDFDNVRVVPNDRHCVQDVASLPDVYSVIAVPTVSLGSNITCAQVTSADTVISGAQAEGENFLFQSSVDTSINNWREGRQRKEKLIRPKTCLPSAYVNTSSSEEEVQRRAVSGYGTYAQNVDFNTDLDSIGMKAGKKRRTSDKGNHIGSQKTVSNEDKLLKVNGYDASSEYTSSEKEQVHSSELDCDNNRSHKISEVNLYSDGNIIPVIRHESMSTIDVTSSDLLNVLGNNLWIPPFNDQMTSQERETFLEDQVKLEGTERYFWKSSEKKCESQFKQPGLKEALHKKVHRQSLQRNQSKSRINMQSISSWLQNIGETSRTQEWNSVLQTRSGFRSSTRIDTRLKYETLRKMYRVAPNRRLLESYNHVAESRPLPVEKKDFLLSGSMSSNNDTAEKANVPDEEPYLPMLIQSNQDQTIPKLIIPPHVVEREVSKPIINQVSRKTFGISAKNKLNYGYSSNPKTRQLKSCVQLSTATALLLPHSKTMDTSFTSKCHVQQKTVTPKNSRAELQEGNSLFSLQRKTESTVCNLSFTPAFTFSIFKLPLDYKLRNEKLKKV